MARSIRFPVSRGILEGAGNWILTICFHSPPSTEEDYHSRFYLALPNHRERTHNGVSLVTCLTLLVHLFLESDDWVITTQPYLLLFQMRTQGNGLGFPETATKNLRFFCCSVYILPRRWIEPWSPAWQAGILTTILTRNFLKLDHVLWYICYKLTSPWFISITLTNICVLCPGWMADHWHTCTLRVRSILCPAKFQCAIKIQTSVHFLTS